MLIHDDTFKWEGFGGAYNLAAGECRLRIIDLSRGDHRNVAHLKPMVVVVSDLPDADGTLRQMSVRSCASHIATMVAAQFNIPPHRMTFVEYAPSSTYGPKGQFKIDAKFDVVHFTWFDDKAMHPKWQGLAPPLLDAVADLICSKTTDTV